MCMSSRPAPAPYVPPPPPAPVVEPPPPLKTIRKEPGKKLKVARTTPNLTVKRKQSSVGGVDTGGAGLSTIS